MAPDIIKCGWCGRPASDLPKIQYWRADDNSIICDHCHERVAKQIGNEGKEVIQEAEAPEAPYTGDKFDYKVAAFSSEEDLKALGRRGWKLVSAVAQPGSLLGKGGPEIKLFLRKKLK